MPTAFERLMLLIATLVHSPGIGCPLQPLTLRDDPKDHHNALDVLQQQLRTFAQNQGYHWPPNYPSHATLQKDLKQLKDYGILDHRRYRWGYYLGTGVMSPRELHAALNALESQAKYQGDPQIRQIYQTLVQRLRGFPFPHQNNTTPFYPVRQVLNRAIIYTDPEEMLEKQQNRHTLFHYLPQLEEAIMTGQAVEISRAVDLYGDHRLGLDIIWPLQLLYRDTAWYLLYERCANSQLVVGRMNRYKDYCRLVTLQGRGVEAQWECLKNAHQLLENGWGLKLGTVEEQQRELAGKGETVKVCVRFFPPISAFMEEGELRHPKQKIKRGKKDAMTGKPEYIDYHLVLPLRSLDEFSIWIQRYADKAQVLSPATLVEKHYQMAIRLLERYKP